MWADSLPDCCWPWTKTPARLFPIFPCWASLVHSYTSPLGSQVLKTSDLFITSCDNLSFPMSTMQRHQPTPLSLSIQLNCLVTQCLCGTVWSHAPQPMACLRKHRTGVSACWIIVRSTQPRLRASQYSWTTQWPNVLNGYMHCCLEPF